MALQHYFIDAAENGPNQRKIPTFNERRDDIAKLTRTEFRSRLRLSTNTYEYLHRILEPAISPKLPCNHAISSHSRLQAALRFYAQGSMLQSNADCYGMSKSSMGSFVNLVTDAIVDRMDDFIKWPQNLATTKAGFYDIAGLPNVTGCIDCTHVNLTGLSKEIEHAYVNRKGNHSVNVQAICDDERVFTDIVAEWPGSCHDTHIFNNSRVKGELEAQNPTREWLLGDSGYPCYSYLLTPYVGNNLTEGEARYNRAHKKTRVVIECAFGELKSRFRCLNKQGGALHYQPGRACRIIAACMCLHNICKRMGEEEFVEEEINININEQLLAANANANIEPAGRAARDNLVRMLYGQ